MLMTQVNRYISLGRALGYQLRELSLSLRAFATFAANRGESHVRASTATEWATAAPSAHSRYIRLRNVVRLADFLHSEDAAHEVPVNPFHASTVRRLPYIYSAEEVAKLLTAASRLRESYPLRRKV